MKIRISEDKEVLALKDGEEIERVVNERTTHIKKEGDKYIVSVPELSPEPICVYDNEFNMIDDVVYSCSEDIVDILSSRYFTGTVLNKFYSIERTITKYKDLFDILGVDLLNTPTKGILKTNYPPIIVKFEGKHDVKIGIVGDDDEFFIYLRPNGYSLYNAMFPYYFIDNLNVNILKYFGVEKVYYKDYPDEKFVYLILDDSRVPKDASEVTIDEFNNVLHDKA